MPEKAEHQQSQYMAAFDEISTHLQEEVDARDFLRLVLRLAVRETVSDQGYLLLRGSGEANYQVIIAQNRQSQLLEGGMDAVAKQLLDGVVKSGQAVIVADAKSDPRLTGSSSEEALSAYMLIPMVSGTKSNGLICLASQTMGHFQDDHRNFVTLLAAISAQVVDRVKLDNIVQRVEDSRHEFISLTTHQLRVPLTSISGYTDILLKGMAGDLNEQQHDFLQIVRRNATRMGVLIDKLGEMNRIESGRRRFDLGPTDVSEVVEAAILDLEDELASKNQELVVDMDPDLPPVLTDSPPVIVVLSALLENASWYSPKDGVLLLQISQGDDHVLFEIIDKGIGIAKSDQEHIFELFYRSDDQSVRELSGWGLSLTHAKKVIEALGGIIAFQSTKDVGSNFYFTLPVAGNKRSKQ